MLTFTFIRSNARLHTNTYTHVLIYFRHGASILNNYNIFE